MQRLRKILDQIRYKDWAFNLVNKNGLPFLQISFFAIHAHTGITALQKGRLWLLDDAMTASEVVQTALKAVLTAEEHEARESFMFRDAPVFGPHLDVEAGAAKLADRVCPEDRLNQIEVLFPLTDFL